MEPNEVQELEEHAEHAEHDRMMRPVALTMTFLAVLVAVTTVLGHRTHTEVVLDQDKATDKWGEYQAQKTRSYNTTLSIDLMKVLTITDKEAAKKIVEGYRAPGEVGRRDERGHGRGQGAGGKGGEGREPRHSL